MVLVQNFFSIFTFDLIDYSAFLTFSTPKAIITLASYGIIWLVLVKAWKVVFNK
jgi:hypothetical protein